MPRQFSRIQAEHALLPQGWRRDVSVELGDDGRIARIRIGDADAALTPQGAAVRVETLVPAVSNLHSHSFQLAFAGRTEGADAVSPEQAGGQPPSFWSWRDVMYSWAARLEADDIEAIAALAFATMLESGYGSVCEFHYLHHDRSGHAYADPAELSARIVTAAETAGIGLTLLPVLYSYGGLDQEPLKTSQRRFGCTLEQFAELLAAASRHVGSGSRDGRCGVALHSLRAVSPQQLGALPQLLGEVGVDAPVHLHVAEQPAEVEAVQAVLGARPVAWLLDNAPVGPNWCLVHATHVDPIEVRGLAASGATIGLCPVTEADLGDGVMPVRDLLDAGGRFGVGTDSNVRISLREELRLLEYGQRLVSHRRRALADRQHGTGESLLRHALSGGAAAAGRHCGAIEEGALADLVALELTSPCYEGVADAQLLDAWLFAAPAHGVREVWSAGRHVVQGGRHVRRPAIEGAAREALRRSEDRYRTGR